MQPAKIFPPVLRILGIDPGTRNVGYGVVEQHGNTLVRLSGGSISAQGDSIAARLVVIHRHLREVILRYRPAAAAVETVFSGNNPKMAIAIGEGRGVAVLSAAEEGLEVQGYEPSLVKRSVAGSGRATKEQVRNMVMRLLALPALPETDHEADALALAITHVRHSRAAGASAGAGGTSERVRAQLAELTGRKRSRSSRRDLPEFILRQLPQGMAAGRKR